MGHHLNESNSLSWRNSLGRRDFLLNSASAALVATASNCFASDAKPKNRLGLVTYCCRIRSAFLRKRDASHKLTEPFTFLEHCRSLGAGGMQIDLGMLSKADAIRLRELAAMHDMFVEAIVSLPKKDSDLDGFEASIRTAREVGVAAARTTIIPGRRYERFSSLEEFREYETRGRRALERAVPITEKYKVPLAVENHKDHRNEERVALFKRIGSEFVGACVDTGNSVSLLEDPMETVEVLAPWAKSVHLKDQAVQAYEDGFLLADISLGQGCFDLKRMVQILRKAKPDVHFSLELITRDPLKVPTQTEKYWSTFPELPAKDLARTMRMVRERSQDNLQYISKLKPEDQLAQEDANVRESLVYARQSLGL